MLSWYLCCTCRMTCSRTLLVVRLSLLLPGPVPSEPPTHGARSRQYALGRRARPPGSPTPRNGAARCYTCLRQSSPSCCDRSGQAGCTRSTTLTAAHRCRGASTTGRLHRPPRGRRRSASPRLCGSVLGDHSRESPICGSLCPRASVDNEAAILSSIWKSVPPHLIISYRPCALRFFHHVMLTLSP